MRRLPIFIAIGLASCGAPVVPVAQDAEAAPISLGSLGAPPLDANGLPKFRAGLWEVVRSDPGADEPPERTRECIGDVPNGDLVRLLKPSETAGCRVSQSRDARGVYVSSDCVQSGVKVRTELSISGSQTSYQMKLVMGVVTPDGKRDDSEIVANAKWISACPAGVAPGDTVELD